MDSWKHCKNILCVRLDNMGDLIMSEPAIRALKETSHCKITVLTSTMARPITPCLAAVDDVLTYDALWVKTNATIENDSFFQMVDILKQKHFDGAVIFSVFSQNPQPAAMLVTLAQIPRRLAYCRENPYNLLTHWVPEQEPYTFIRHQVKRDLDLVRHVGAEVKDTFIRLKANRRAQDSLTAKLGQIGIDLSKPWMILHPGVSEDKRKYPVEHWIETGKRLMSDLGYQLILTGSANDVLLTRKISYSIGHTATSCAGILSVEELVCLISQAPLVISVNTATIHIAAATRTKTIVLYALTNPQHSPWKGSGKVFPYSVPENVQSRNEVLHFVQEKHFSEYVPLPTPGDIVAEAKKLLAGESTSIPELIFPDVMIHA